MPTFIPGLGFRDTVTTEPHISDGGDGGERPMPPIENVDNPNRVS
jgi:hypothetical protein